MRNCCIKQCTKHGLSSSPVAVNHRSKMLPFLPVTMVLLLVTGGQSQQGHPKCGSSDCVIISSCPSFLKLVTQVIFTPFGEPVSMSTQLKLAQAALRAPPEVVLQCVAGHCYYHRSVFLSFFLSFSLFSPSFAFDPLRGNSHV